jgi:hypothetical protein
MQLGVESVLGIFSIAGGLLLLGISIARASVGRRITNQRKKPVREFNRTRK